MSYDLHHRYPPHRTFGLKGPTKLHACGDRNPLMHSLSPLSCLLGKCVVSSFKDYLSCRPTEVPEENVLLCESRYIESEKQMKKFKGLKRFSLSGKVVEDEIYYFR